MQAGMGLTRQCGRGDRQEGAAGAGDVGDMQPPKGSLLQTRRFKMYIEETSTLHVVQAARQLAGSAASIVGRSARSSMDISPWLAGASKGTQVTPTQERPAPPYGPEMTQVGGGSLPELSLSCKCCSLWTDVLRCT